MMEKAYDLDTFTKILADKGYSGYFFTQAAYPDKLKESIRRYLEECRNGTEDMRKPELLLNTYLQYNGEEKPSINCYMWIKYHHETFELQRMEIVKKDQYGQLMKQSELPGLSVSTAPTASEAIAMVNNELKQKTAPLKKRFGL